jgi:hypothetical protein
MCIFVILAAEKGGGSIIASVVSLVTILLWTTTVTTFILWFDTLKDTLHHVHSMNVQMHRSGNMKASHVSLMRTHHVIKR